LKLKKSLGQHIFTNKNLGEKITDVVLSDKPDRIIEIGPGTGAFTTLLAAKIDASNIIVVEKDDYLASRWSEYHPDIKLLHKDFLDSSLLELIQSENPDIMPQTVIFGSLPYNISKKIIRKCLVEATAINLASNSSSNRKPIKSLFFIIQKEVAEKYEAPAHIIKNEHLKVQNNPLSITSSLFANAKSLIDISPHSFVPQPKVMSSFIRFDLNPARYKTVENLFITTSRMPLAKEASDNFELLYKNQLERIVIVIENFEDFIHKAFKKPLKTISNNLMLKNTKWSTVRAFELHFDAICELFTEYNRVI